jgi:hypothetical protein
VGEAGNDSHTTQTVSKRCVGNKTHKEGRVRNRLPCVRRLGAMGNGCHDMRQTERGNERDWLAWREKGSNLAGGCAEQDAHAALPQAGEGVLERVAADAVEHAVHAGTT